MRADKEKEVREAYTAPRPAAALTPFLYIGTPDGNYRKGTAGRRTSAENGRPYRHATTTMKQYSFPKAEHLCLQRDIEALFSAGSHAATAYPLRAVFRLVDADRGPAVKILLSVAKRRLHLATDRNRAKRQLREAYRLNKHALDDMLPAGRHLHIGFIWLADRPQKTERVAGSVRLLLQRIAEKSHRATARPQADGTAPAADGTVSAADTSNSSALCADSSSTCS